MRIGIDIDGVLANFNESFARLLVAESGRVLCPSTWVDSDPPCWAWDAYFGYTADEIGRAWDIVENSPIFWEQLYPLPGVYKVLENLNRIVTAGDEVYFLTNRSGYKCKRQTERWLHQRGMLLPCVLLAPDKTLFVRGLDLNIYIDDNLDNINDVARVAYEEQVCSRVYGHVYLKDARYNQEGRRPDLHVVDSVKEMLEREGLWK